MPAFPLLPINALQGSDSPDLEQHGIIAGPELDGRPDP